MRKVIKWLVASVLILTGGTVIISCSSNHNDPEQVISFNKLPVAAQNFVAKNYPNAKVVSVVKDSEHSGSEYELLLSDGTKIEFSNNGDWTDINAPMGQSIPDKIAPTAIVSYIESNYPSIGINEIAKKSWGYEIELINGLDLRFSATGTFIGIDY